MQFRRYLPERMFNNIKHFTGEIHVAQSTTQVFTKMGLFRLIHASQLISAKHTWADPPNEKHVAEAEYTALAFVTHEFQSLLLQQINPHKRP